MEEMIEIRGKYLTIDEVIEECKKMSALYKAGKLKTVPFEEIMKE